MRFPWPMTTCTARQVEELYFAPPMQHLGFAACNLTATLGLIPTNLLLILPPSDSFVPPMPTTSSDSQGDEQKEHCRDVPDCVHCI